MADRISFGVPVPHQASGQMRVEVRFGGSVVGFLGRWRFGDIARHGWFFEGHGPLPEACFDFGFPPGRETLAAAKQAVRERAQEHRLA